MYTYSVEETHGWASSPPSVNIAIPIPFGSGAMGALSHVCMYVCMYVCTCIATSTFFK